MFDPVARDELTHDLNSQKAAQRHQRIRDRMEEKAKDEVVNGRWDSDMANFFDGEMLMRIARRLATGEKQNPDDINEIKLGLEDYETDLAERKAMREAS